MQQRIFSPENPEGVVRVYTAEEVAEVKKTSEEGRAQVEKEKADFIEKENLKASARAKLVAGEALTQEEADTIVI